MSHRLAAAAIAALLLPGCGPAPGDITPLSLAARRGDTREITRLAAAGEDVNRPDPALNHWTPLLHAIHKAQRASVDALIAAGADVNRLGPEGLTPLIMAAGNGQAGIVRRLLEAGADPHVASDDLIEVAVSGGALTDIEQPIFGRCNTEVLTTLLRRAPDLRLRRPLRGRLALLFARLNHCDQVIRMVKTS
jgi:ankyrin repeat protein